MRKGCIKYILCIGRFFVFSFALSTIIPIFAVLNKFIDFTIPERATVIAHIDGLFLCPILKYFGCLSHSYFALRSKVMNLFSDTGNGSRFSA